MLTIALIAVIAVLIILERTKKVNISNMGAGIFMMCSTCIVTGLYIFDFVNVILALFINLLGLNKSDERELLEVIAPLFKGMSTTSVIIKLVLLITLFIPFAIGAVYIIQLMARKPLLKGFNESDASYRIRCGMRTLSLGMIASVCFFISLTLMIVCSIPYMDMFIKSLVLFNPLLVFIVFFCTFGIGLFYLGGMFAAMNATLAMILICFGIIALSFYIFSVVMGISACVRAKKAGTLNFLQALVYGIFCFMTGWNIIVFVMLRSQLKKSQKEMTYGQPF